MFRRTHRSDEDFNEEVRAHLEIEADRLMAEDGLGRKEALADALRSFGNVTKSREQFYESARFMWLDNVTRDVRYAWRQIKNSPVSAATVILSLALGIGVNTAIFSLADQALVRALPVEEPNALVLLEWNGKFVGGGVGRGHMPHQFYRELRDEIDAFEDVFASHLTGVHLSVGDEPEPVTAELVSGSYFPTLGVRPALGRLLTDADDLTPAAHPVVVLSYDYWQSRLGADPAIVGKRIFVNSFPMTVTGVAEQGFHGMDWGMAPSIWMPIMMKRQATPDWNALDDRRTRWLDVFGRLKPGISQEQMEARLQPWFKAYLRADTKREGWPQVTEEQMSQYMASELGVAPAARGRSWMRQRIEQPMLVLLAASFLILLLACLNVANLSLARALSRRRATALRGALGASRWRILTEQLVESALLAAAGCSVGALIAPPVSRVILSFLPQLGGGGVALSADLDVRVLLFALGITALTTLLAGTGPALYATSIQPVNALKRQSSAAAGGLSLRKALVVGQFALALILLIGAGLFARTLGSLKAQGPGFPTTHLMMFGVDPLSNGYQAAEAKPLIRRLLTALQELPEVEQAGVGRWEMLRGSGWSNPVTVESSERFVTDITAMNAVSPRFFEALRAPVTRGRGFDERDSRDDSSWALRSAIVNEEFVKRYFGASDPIGARMAIGDEPDVVAEITVVGVVKTFHDYGLREPETQVFFPLWERPVGEGTFYVRVRGSSDTAAQSIRAAVKEVDPKLTILSLRTMDDQLERMLTSERMLATLAGAFAAAATLLAMVGLYGVLSFSAALRTKEIGIRFALGAPQWAAGGLIVREAGVLAVAGLVIAIPAAWALGRLVESQLFGVRPMDASSIAGAAAVLTLVCLGASAVVARRAGSADPLAALRTE